MPPPPTVDSSFQCTNSNNNNNYYSDYDNNICIHRIVSDVSWKIILLLFTAMCTGHTSLGVICVFSVVHKYNNRMIARKQKCPIHFENVMWLFFFLFFSSINFNWNLPKSYLQLFSILHDDSVKVYAISVLCDQWNGFPFKNELASRCEQKFVDFHHTPSYINMVIRQNYVVYLQM